MRNTKSCPSFLDQYQEFASTLYCFMCVSLLVLSASLKMLQCLIKAAPSDHPHLQSLKTGLEASQRVAEAINDALRRDENTQVAKRLQLRVVDWKGLNAESLGQLLLSDVFLVSRMGTEVDREYQIYVFEKIILCCKEARSSGHDGTLNGPKLLSLGFSQRNEPTLMLRGRVLLSGVTEVVSLPPTTGSNSGSFYLLLSLFVLSLTLL